MRLAIRNLRSRLVAAAPLAIAGGAAVALGAWLPWMSYFAGLIPLRGLIGINGRLLLVAGVIGLSLGCALFWTAAPKARAYARRASGLLGLVVGAASVWLLVGMWQLTRVHSSNAMMAPKPGIGLLVILVGGLLLSVAAVVPDRVALATAR
jgi:hypothetical protein